MKRCFSVALILALLGTTVVSPAWAEELEVISEEIEPSVSEVEVIDAPEFIGESSEEAPQETSSEAVEEAAPDVVVQGDIPEATGAESNSLEEEVSQPEAEAEPQAATGMELSRKSSPKCFQATINSGTFITTVRKPTGSEVKTLMIIAIPTTPPDTIALGNMKNWNPTA